MHALERRSSESEAYYGDETKILSGTLAQTLEFSLMTYLLFIIIIIMTKARS